MQTRKIADLKPYGNNARTHSPEQISEIARSIAEFGFNNPVLIDAKDNVIAGHGRILAAGELGFDPVPVMVIDHLTPAQQRAYILADNRIALNAGWSPELLKTEFEALLQDGFDVALTGFTQHEIDAFLNPEILSDITEDPDAVPEIVPDPITVPGDVWVLGKHRLMCGDSTMLDQVERLMDGKNADLCLTDPPYSVNYEESHKQRGGDKNVHANYQEADINPDTFLKDFMALIPCDVLIMSYPIDRHFFALADAVKNTGFEFRKELIWAKDSFSFWIGAKYQQKHEPILLLVKKGKPLGGKIPADQSTILEFKRPKRHEMHPTAKPVELWELFVKYHTNPNDIIYDPFGGSGTTLIACEKLGRKCLMMELSPAYNDVIIKRWQKFTGKEVIHEESGKTWNQLNQEMKTAPRIGSITEDII